MKKNTWAPILGAIGVVYGDIGTSPLYAFKQFFSPTVGLQANLPTCWGRCR